MQIWHTHFLLCPHSPPDLHSNITHRQNALQPISSWMTAKTEFLLIRFKQVTTKNCHLCSQSRFHLWRTSYFIGFLKILLFSYSWTSLYPPITWSQNSQHQWRTSHFAGPNITSFTGPLLQTYPTCDSLWLHYSQMKSTKIFQISLLGSRRQFGGRCPASLHCSVPSLFQSFG